MLGYVVHLFTNKTDSRVSKRDRDMSSRDHEGLRLTLPLIYCVDAKRTIASALMDDVRPVTSRAVRQTTLRYLLILSKDTFNARIHLP